MPSSKLEKFVISKMCLEEQIIKLISKYIYAINSLNKIEREVFIKTNLYEAND